MRTATAVENGKKRTLTDVDLGRIYRKTGDILRRIKQGNLDFEQFLWVLQRQVENFFSQRAVYGPYVVEVNYDRALEDAAAELETSGKIEGGSDDRFLNSLNFPRQGHQVGKKKLSLFLVDHVGEMSYPARADEVRMMGFQNGTPYEFLSFIDQCHELISANFSWATVYPFGQRAATPTYWHKELVLLEDRRIKEGDWEEEPRFFYSDLSLAFNEVPN